MLVALGEPTLKGELAKDPCILCRDKNEEIYVICVCKIWVSAVIRVIRSGLELI